MKQIRIILLLVIGTLSVTAYAATSKNDNKRMTAEEIARYNRRRFDIHNVAAWGGLGYSGLIHPKQTLTNDQAYFGESKVVGGAAFVIGAGYEYNYKHLLVSVGPEFRIFSSKDKMSLSQPLEVRDLEYDQIKRYYLSNMREEQVLGQLSLPIMVGGQWDYIYFKGGLKLGYTLASSYKQKMNIQSAILDPQAYSEWTDMPNHYNTGLQTVTQKGKTNFGLDVDLCAEVGVNLDQLLSEEWRAANEAKDRPMRMRLAVFADFGLNNMSIKNDNQDFVTEMTADHIQTQSWQSSAWGVSKLNSLLVGVKFTWMLQMNKIKDERQLDGYFAVLTYDDKTKAPLGGTALQIKNVATNKVTKKTTNSRGLTSKREPEGDFVINAQHVGYEDVVNFAYSHGKTNDTARIAMQKIVVEQPPVIVADTVVPIPIVTEQPIILSNLFFALNQVTILPSSEAGLNSLYQLLSQHPEIRIRITGHTDNIGTERANQKLSEGRANSVRQAMIDRGIDGARMDAEGKGESMPIDTNDTEEGRQNNRRVEITILK